MKGTVNTLNSLVEYGKYLEFRGSLHLSNTVLYRIRIDGKEYLQTKLVSHLNVKERVKRFFHSQDFRIETIQRVASNAFEEMDTTAAHLLRKKANKHQLDLVISLINDEIEKNNTRIQGRWKWVSRLFRREVLSKIEIPSIISKDCSESLEQLKVPDCANLSEIPGLENTGNHCYCNAVVQALRAVTGFRKMLDEMTDKTMVNTTLRDLFAEMDGQLGKGKKGRHVVGCKEGSVYDRFKAAIGVFYSPILAHQPQDAGELLRVTIDKAFSRSSLLVAGKVDAKTSFIPLQVFVDRTKIAETDTVRLQKSRQADVPPPEALYISSLDHKRDVELDQLLTIQIPEKAPLLDIQDIFLGRAITEQADLSSIIDKENLHNPWLTPEQRKAIEERATGKNKVVFTVPVVTGLRFAVSSPQEAPSWTAVYIPRFKDGRKKNRTPVLAPYFLHVPVGEKSMVTYVLASVIAHEGGSSIRSGHYTTYLSTRTSEGKKTPAVWAYASDGTVTDLPYEKVAMGISHDGCIFLYDKMVQR